MMHISEAVTKYPQLVPLHKGELDEEVWHQMILHGEMSRFLEGIPSVLVHFDADAGKPLTFDKEEEEAPYGRMKTITYTIKNK